MLSLYPVPEYSIAMEYMQDVEESVFSIIVSRNLVLLRAWCQQLSPLNDKDGKKLFLPPRFHLACQRFCNIPAG